MNACEARIIDVTADNAYPAIKYHTLTKSFRAYVQQKTAAYVQMHVQILLFRRMYNKRTAVYVQILVQNLFFEQMYGKNTVGYVQTLVQNDLPAQKHPLIHLYPLKHKRCPC